MTKLRLTSVSHESDWGENERYELHYIRGRFEATVKVIRNSDGHLMAECQELEADSIMDEMLLEEHAYNWVDVNGNTLGEVDQ